MNFWTIDPCTDLGTISEVVLTGLILYSLVSSGLKFLDKVEEFTVLIPWWSDIGAARSISSSEEEDESLTASLVYTSRWSNWLVIWDYGDSLSELTDWSSFNYESYSVEVIF